MPIKITTYGRAYNKKLAEHLDIYSQNFELGYFDLKAFIKRKSIKDCMRNCFRKVNTCKPSRHRKVHGHKFKLCRVYWFIRTVAFPAYTNQWLQLLNKAIAEKVGRWVWGECTHCCGSHLLAPLVLKIFRQIGILCFHSSYLPSSYKCHFSDG